MEKAHILSGNRSAGNGSLMRTIPVVLGYVNQRDKMLNLAKRISSLTHYDNIVERCVVYYCDIVRDILLGDDLHNVLLRAKHYAPFEFDLTIPLEDLKTSGYVIHTLQAALTCAYQTRSFEDALLTAVNLGGDTDTIGAVTGGLVGAFYGLKAIPSRWIEPLEVRDELLIMAQKLNTVSH